MKHINERRGVAVLRRQAQLVILAAFGVVAQALLAFLFFDHRMVAAGQPALAVQFNMRAVGEDDRLASVQFRRAVGVAPQDIKREALSRLARLY